MEKIVEQALLYDFYGELLTEHQRQVYVEAVMDDMSLSEIAEAHGISRQGVHDLVKRCDKILREYEDKLHLMHKFHQTKLMVDQIRQLTEEYQESGESGKLEEIKQIADEILAL